MIPAVCKHGGKIWYMKKIHALIACCFLGMALHAQELKQNDSTRQIELPEALIKTRKFAPLDERQRHYIGMPEIKKQNLAQDLPYVLNMLSSVVVSSDAGTGTGYTGIRIRGADLTRINVTLNGVPVNDAESQATFFVDMPDLLSSTKEIQVSKGAGFSKNGVGNFGASIALNNLDVDQRKPGFLYESSVGSFRTYKNLLKLSTGLINDRFAATVRLSGIQSDGYIRRSGANLKGMQATAKYLAGKHTQVVFNYMNGHEITGQAWNGVAEEMLKTDRRYNELGLKPDGSFYRNQTDNYGQQYYQLFLDHQLNDHWAFGSTLFYTRGKGYYEEYKQQQAYAAYALPDVVIGGDTLDATDMVRQLWLDNHFFGGRLYANYVSSRFDAGLYLNVNRYNGHHFGEVIWAQNPVPEHYRWYNLDAHKQDMNAYGILHYRFNSKTAVVADMQLRQVNYTINGFRNNPGVKHDLDFLFFNPKVKLQYQRRRQQWSLVAGIAQKEPNREDVEAGKQQLPKPEKMYNAELNVSTLIPGNVVLQLTGYAQYYRDQLVMSGKINDVGAYTRINVPESYRAGVECDLGWKPLHGILELKANAALSTNKIVSFTGYIDDYDQGGQIATTYAHTDISFSPALIAALQVGYYPLRHKGPESLHELSIDLMQKYVGEQYLDNTGDRSKIIAAFANTDLILNCPLKLKASGRLRARAGMYNVLGSLYSSNGYTYSYRYDNQVVSQNYYFPQAGRRWMLGMGIEL